MKQQQIELKIDGDKTMIRISGPIDEDLNFNQIELNSAAVVIDLAGVTSINSCGIREWCKWINQAATSNEIQLIHCPRIIVDQINMVEGFVPANGSIESFFVPYFNEDSGEEKNILFKKGEHFLKGKLMPPATVLDSQGHAMEMDVIEAKYFKFLSHLT